MTYHQMDTHPPLRNTSMMYYTPTAHGAGSQHHTTACMQTGIWYGACSVLQTPMQWEYLRLVPTEGTDGDPTP